MGVHVIRLAVRRPAGVPDAERSRQQRAVFGLFDQVLQPSLRFGELQAPVRAHADARRVIAAVFQPRQALQQNGRSLLPADVSNDTTHIKLSS